VGYGQTVRLILDKKSMIYDRAERECRIITAAKRIVDRIGCDAL
jgi:hypothetical protein